VAWVLGQKLDDPSLRKLEGGNVLIKDEGELAALHHEAGKVAHYCVCLYVKIAEHNVGAPSPEQRDQICVHLGAHKCHGVTDPAGARTYIFRPDTRSLYSDGDAEIGGDVCGGHTGPASGRQAIKRNWGGTDRTVKWKGFHSPGTALSWVAVGAATSSNSMTSSRTQFF
jgi:hypothetical protein